MSFLKGASSGSEAVSSVALTVVLNQASSLPVSVRLLSVRTGRPSRRRLQLFSAASHRAKSASVKA